MAVTSAFRAFLKYGDTYKSDIRGFIEEQAHYQPQNQTAKRTSIQCLDGSLTVAPASGGFEFDYLHFRLELVIPRG